MADRIMVWEVRISSKGHVTLPRSIRRRLAIKPGDSVQITIEDGAIVIRLTEPRVFKTEIITDPVTGLPVLSAGPGAPVLTSKDVREMLADFP
jgi:AbrB family looped-hinge helix DNA binding protein